ncbi:MAG: C40 family peptidase [Nocardioidaceae bacterium]|nr:C40 family peptidase [Nocardioidaceae bacterium]
MTAHEVSVDVATGWTSPDAPRDIDTPAVADVPDVAAWTRSMDREDRQGLHGRTLTQLSHGEPVEVVEESGDWVRVVAPWQPDPSDPRGYPAWVRRAHLSERSGDEPAAPEPLVDADRVVVAEVARRFVGLLYLWGGTSPWGFDCSGLVHYSYRQAGVVVPRDAQAQQQAAAEVPLGAEQPGDLYFFARGDGPVTHVGFVTDRLRMLHAPESGGLVEDAPMSAERLATLVAVGRLLP